MSVEGERAFSGHQSTNVNHRFEHSLTTFRSKLLPDILEVVECAFPCTGTVMNSHNFSFLGVSVGVNWVGDYLIP